MKTLSLSLGHDRPRNARKLSGLGSVGIQREFMTAAAILIMAAKL
jgi:hypothetical protein